MADDIADKIQSLLSDEESMNQIKELAAMFGGMNGGAENGGGDAPSPQAVKTAENAEAVFPESSDGGLNIDPFAVMKLLGAASAKDKDCELLLALKPHLSYGRQQRIDKAVKLLKLYNIFIAMRENGMLNDLEKML